MRVDIILYGIVAYSLFGLIGKRAKMTEQLQIFLFLSNMCINSSKY